MNIQSSTLWRLLAFLKPRRFQYFFSMTVIAILYAIERLGAGYVVMLFVNSITALDPQLLKTAILIWLAFAAFLILTTPVFSYLWRASVAFGTANIRLAVFSHLQRLPLGYYETRHSGEAMSILTNDVAAAEKAYQDDIMSLVQSIFQGVSAAIVMMFVKWDLALLIILSGMLPLLVNTLYAKPLRLIGQETQDKLAGLSERMADLLGGYQVVRTFLLGSWILERFSDSNKVVLNANLKRVRIESTLAGANVFSWLITILPYIYGTILVMDGKITLGILFALIQLNNPVQNFVYSLSGTVSRIQGALAAGDRILKLLDEPPEPRRYLPAYKPGALRDLLIPEVADGVVVAFRDVQFKYADGVPILQCLSFDIQGGQTAAFVGPSGSGKSTIFRLLMGYYPLGDGVVSVYGKSIYDYPLSELRDLTAFVPQDAYLYQGSILDNIRYGKITASEEEILQAARAAYAHDFILELPEGYDTLVGERGARLSGGQRQRIAIARALLKNAPILLLDEATSALDSESEEVVQQALNALMQGRTTIAIAHRLSTVENADVIYVVDKGRVVEQGKHTELVRQGGLYSYLYELQFKDSSQPALPAVQNPA